MQALLEARPIVLLAQLYRLWAAARAVDLVRWIEFHKLSPWRMHRATRRRRSWGLLAAGMLEEAEATRRDGAVLALDQSKAYDRVPLDLLEELLRDSGVHPAIGGPKLCMARSKRRIKILDAIGESRLPSSGLVPGCPMATFGGPPDAQVAALGERAGADLAWHLGSGSRRRAATSEEEIAHTALLGRR